MKKKKMADFTATLGDERRRKLKRIAERENRSMAGQVCQWIDETPDPKAASHPEKE